MLAMLMTLSSCASRPVDTRDVRSVLLDRCDSARSEWGRADNAIAVATDVRAIEVRQDGGSIFVRSGPTERIETHAVIQCLRPQSGAATMRHWREGDRLIVQSGFAAKREGHDWQTEDGRIDLTLWVPTDRPLSLLTESGNINVRGPKQGVDANTTTGDINVAAKGAMRLHSREGSIVVSQRDVEALHDLDIHTRGNVQATLLRGRPVDLLAVSCGTLDSDLEEARRDRDEQGCERLALRREGDAMPRIRLWSTQGRLVLSTQDFVVPVE